MQIDDEYRLDHDIISESLEDILYILSANKTGVSNPEAKEKITALAEMVRETTTDSLCGEKTVEIKTWADACYSTGKHEQYIMCRLCDRSRRSRLCDLTATIAPVRSRQSVTLTASANSVAADLWHPVERQRAVASGVPVYLLVRLSVGDKLTKKYPGLFGFYAKGKDLPQERKIYKYRFVRIDPSKFVFWTGYKYGKHVPAKPRKEDSKDVALDLGDESNVGVIAGLLGSADDEPEMDKLPLNEDWLGELEAAAASGVITPEEGRAIGSATIGLQDLARSATPGKVTEGEKKLLKKWKSGAG